MEHKKDIIFDITAVAEVMKEFQYWSKDQLQVEDHANFNEATYIKKNTVFTRHLKNDEPR